jgi:hypothetical protein
MISLSVVCFHSSIAFFVWTLLLGTYLFIVVPKKKKRVTHKNLRYLKIFYFTSHREKK